METTSVGVLRLPAAVHTAALLSAATPELKAKLGWRPPVPSSPAP
jgi:hypothetical protein